MKRIIVLSGLAGCGASYKYTANRKSLARPPGCEFRVVAAPPTDTRYQEVGIFDLDGMQVCAAGGDLVVAEINGLGGYVRGTVFKLQ